MQPSSLKTRAGHLEYTITNRPRITKRLHMELDEQGGLVVVVPRHWSKRYIHATLAQNIHRVERFLAGSRKRPSRPLTYVAGEKHLYLGEKYSLVTLDLATWGSKVELVNGELRVRASSPDRVKSVLKNWYLQRARVVFGERLPEIAKRAPWAKDRNIPLKLRRMKRTWGNCSSQGVIKLNTHLVKAPITVIDSVIAHELCHLEEMNHGPAFYSLLDNLNPDWRLDKARLKSEGFNYLLT